LIFSTIHNASFLEPVGEPALAGQFKTTLTHVPSDLNRGGLVCGQVAQLQYPR
jgi:hypothetical protein